MDQQQPQANPGLPPTPAPVPIVPNAAPAQAVTSGGGSNKKALIIVVVLILVLAALVGGGYYYFTMMQSASSTTPPTPVQNPTTQVPKATTEPSLDDQLNAIQIDDGSSDFATIDKDISSL
jgi:uncharacterized protein HemX